MNDLTPAQYDSASMFGASTRRGIERTPLIRTAKLVFPDGQYPCVLRDISGDALRVKLFGVTPPNDGKTFWLEFGDGDRFEVTLIWLKDGHAGLSFVEHNDLLSLIGENGPFRKRAIRIGVELPATVKSLGRMIPVLIRDLSHQGAQIECDHMFSMDQQVRIDVPALGEVYAKVRWRRHPGYGLAFVETFRFEDIAEVAVNLQNLSRVWREGVGGSAPSAGIAA
ncbi:PilZ domain-containing protein [Croceicoccus naphthovorans]|uniref:PilZ domain-containing protein n=1 Tax=Croceicoccus naphthovorans TaxID=1348774 RepID=UPI00069CBF75|nr:PilZ domain-containing protein [Croceicoccus naphthovorans]MBB3989245.1 hypothetical protein [Croceicoccus naphthovorans]